MKEIEQTVVNKEDELSNDDFKSASEAVRKDVDTPAFQKKARSKVTEDIASRTAKDVANEPLRPNSMKSSIDEEVRHRMRQHPKKLNNFVRKKHRKPPIRRAISKLAGRRKRRRARRAAHRARKEQRMKRRK